MMAADPVTQFRMAMSEAGLIPPAELIPDGKIHRCDTDDGVRGKGDGAYILFLDGLPAGGFQNWRGGEFQKWHAELEREPTVEERAKAKTNIAKLKKEREAEAKRRAKNAQTRAVKLLSAAEPAGDDHPYLVRKAVAAHGVRVAEDGRLIVPLRDDGFVLHSLQFIDEDGAKLFLYGGRVQGCFHLIGEPAGILCVAEGFATGATIHQVTGHAVAIAFNAGNLLAVAKAVRGKFSGQRILLCADDDHLTAGNPGITKATEAARAVGGMVAIPEFGPARPEKATDFNDLAAHSGPDAVRRCIDAALAEPKQPHDLPGAEYPDSGLTDTRPEIRFIAQILPEIVNQAENALISANLGVFQRAGMLVRPVETCVAIRDGNHALGIRLAEVTKPTLIELLTKAANWQKYDSRAEDWRPTSCPPLVAEIYGARSGKWRVPELTGIINAPSIRPDGSVIDQPGYDAKTGLLFDPLGVDFGTLLPHPTRRNGENALAALQDLIATFPFKAPQDLAVALSGILTAVARPAIDAAPLHAFTAPAAGSGKSLLVDIASMIATGRAAGVISQGRDEPEAEKRLGSALIAGDSIISIDNCELPLGGELLCQVITQPMVKVRVLGLSVNRDIPNGATVFATGNNLSMLGDMTRRTLLGAIDPEHERPELRKFSASPIDMITADRAKYVRAALTVLRAYIVAGRPRVIDPLGSFSSWSNLVRSALIWLDAADPCLTIEATRATDPKLEALTAVSAQWNAVIRSDRVAVRDVIQSANRTSYNGDFANPEFRDALLVIAGDGSVINGRRLGKWLTANKDRKVNGKRFVQAGLIDGVMRWQLV